MNSMKTAVALIAMLLVSTFGWVTDAHALSMQGPVTGGVGGSPPDGQNGGMITIEVNGESFLLEFGPGEWERFWFNWMNILNAIEQGTELVMHFAGGSGTPADPYQAWSATPPPSQ